MNIHERKGYEKSTITAKTKDFLLVNNVQN